MPPEIPLLGEAFNSPTGRMVVPMTTRGEESRRAVLAKVASGQYASEQVACLCGSNHEQMVCSVDRYRITNRTVLCVDCGLVRTSPRWNQAAYSDFYANYYRSIYERPGHSREAMFAVQSANAAERAAFIRPFLPTDGSHSVLEIGCGGGWNLAPFRDEGHAVVGYDYDKDYLAAGQARGLDVRLGGIDEALAAGQRHQVVILSHVVEHFLQPVQELIRIRELLAPAGLMYVEVPNLFSVDRDLMRYWQSAHTYSFVPDTLRALMGQAGFREIALTPAIASLWRADLPALGPWRRDPALAARTREFLLSREHDTSGRLLLRRLKRGWKKMVTPKRVVKASQVPGGAA